MVMHLSDEGESGLVNNDVIGKISDELQSLMDFLMERVKSNGGKLPSYNDVEFYNMVEYVSKEFGVSLKEIAEKLGVNYSSLRVKLNRAKKKLSEIGEEGEKGVEALGPSFVKIVTDKVRKYFGNRIDGVTANMVGMIVDIGIEFFDKHYAWCKENGREVIQCMNEGMLFFRKYKDKVEELESKLEDYRNLATALLSTDKEIISRMAVIESFKKVLEDEVRKGKIRPDQLNSVLESVENYVNKVISNE